MTTHTTHEPIRVTLIDNRDSFVYNLVDAFAVAGMDCTVYRNNVDPHIVMDGHPDLICLSPGPGHPREAGTMMELIDLAVGKIPILGICLGFQALIEHFGGQVVPCGPVHGATDSMILTQAGIASEIFQGLASMSGGKHVVPVARYHSLGCSSSPSELISLAECHSEIGPVTMAGMTADGMALGLQFHPESVLSPQGPIILTNSVASLRAAYRATHACTKADPNESKDTSMTLRDYLTHTRPSVDEAREVFAPLADGKYTDVEIAALLCTIRARGETANDIAGAAAAFLDRAVPVAVDGDSLVDCCGTGGDGANTINVSTAAGLVAAAGGVKMIKHGNRSVSSKSGSADLLEALGIPLDVAPNKVPEKLDRDNFVFLFAPAYHPAIANVMPVRRALAIPTIFNVLGPLLNPAHPGLQLMGIANKDLGPTIIDTMKTLGRKKALVVHGDGIDEIAVHGPTDVWELNNDEITHYRITPQDLGLASYSLDDLVGGTAADNAQLIKDVFAGSGAPAHRDAIAANAGALFYLNSDADTLAEGVAMAAKLIDSGKVADYLSSHFGAR